MNIHTISRRFNLTKAEEQILRFVVAGQTTNEIAKSLNISVKTVESHRSKCIKKLNIEGKKNALLHYVIQNKISV